MSCFWVLREENVLSSEATEAVTDSHLRAPTPFICQNGEFKGFRTTFSLDIKDYF